MKNSHFLALAALPFILSSTLACAAPSSINKQAILANAPGLNAKVLNYAIKGYDYAAKHSKIGNPNVITVVDFTKPSYDKRLWVINLNTNQVVMNTYTAQGKNSGVTYATRFSNQPHSLESSLGVFETAGTYYGEHGYSEHLKGLEQGINSNAYSRAIEVHRANYVTPSFIKANHRAGRSWGCFAMNPAVTDKFINLTKGGSVVFAYASPEQNDSNLI